MIVEQSNMAGKVGKFIESVDVEKVLPIATTNEKRMRFEWEQKPSENFLMTWNQCMEPNSMFVEELDDQGIGVTLRWGLMKQTPEKIRDLLNGWLAKTEQGQYRRSGISGKHLGYGVVIFL